MTKKNLADLLRQESEKEPDTEVGVEATGAELATERDRSLALEQELATERDRSLALEQELATERDRSLALEQELASQQELVKKLYTNLQTLQAEKTPAPAPPPPVTTKVTKPPKAAPSRVRPAAIAPRRTLSESSPSPNPVRLTNEDIGWFD